MRVFHRSVFVNRDYTAGRTLSVAVPFRQTALGYTTMEGASVLVVPRQVCAAPCVEVPRFADRTVQRVTTGFLIFAERGSRSARVIACVAGRNACVNVVLEVLVVNTAEVAIL